MARKQVEDIQHHQLVWMADRWLKGKASCGIVFRDAFGAATPHGEIPDAVGWRQTTSILVECKATRSDYLADRGKPFRINSVQGVGDWRFYLCPKGLIAPGELPRGWGLLYASGTRIYPVCGLPDAVRGWTHRAPFSGNKKAELQLMYSALRRFAVRGHLDVIYLPAGKSVDIPMDSPELA